MHKQEECYEQRKRKWKQRDRIFGIIDIVIYRFETAEGDRLELVVGVITRLDYSDYSGCVYRHNRNPR